MGFRVLGFVVFGFIIPESTKHTGYEGHRTQRIKEHI